ncbi:MAG TPA: DnaJ domain-containing protein, partial [Dehalococcoidia bacterium]|nr:DnaJ domain-containing protein [Dehalococcoidia bacterium]
MADRDFYEVLGLTPAADGAAIDRAYWQLARRYQAEAVNDPRASALLDELNEAYNVLGVPYMRADYDAARREALAGIAAGQNRRRRRPVRREAGETQALSLPAPVIAGAAAATLLAGGLAAAWLAGYGVAALVVTLFFGGSAAGAYLLLGNA